AKSEGGDARLSLEAEGLAWEIALPLPRAAAFSRSPIGRPAASARSGAPSSQEAPVVENPSAPLAGKRLLVVEDEPLVALDMVHHLEEAGAETAAPIGTVKEALQIIESGSFDAALLDGNLRGQKVDEVAATLTRRNIPFLFVSGYGPESLPRAFRSAAALSKPFSPESLVEAVARLVQPGANVVRLRD